MKRINLLLLGLALSGVVISAAAQEDRNPLRQKLSGKSAAAPAAAQSTAAPAQPVAAEDRNPLRRKLGVKPDAAKQDAAAQPAAPAQRVAAAPVAKEGCGKKKHKNHGKGWAKGHDKHC